MADEFCREQGYLQAGTARPFSLPAAMVAMVSPVLMWVPCSWWGLTGDRCCGAAAAAAAAALRWQAELVGPLRLVHAQRQTRTLLSFVFISFQADNFLVYERAGNESGLELPRICTGMACTAYAVIECVPIGGEPCVPDSAQNIGNGNTGGCWGARTVGC